jgi:quinate dehydrogenase
MPSDLSIALRDSYDHGLPIFYDAASRNKEFKIPLLGYPIHHSLSPAVQNHMYGTKNLPWKYYLLESKEPKDLLDALDSQDPLNTCIGAGVTMPHKVTFMSHVDDVTSSGKVIGAINTIFLRRDRTTRETKRIGTNTDSIGISRSFTSLPSSLVAPDASSRPGLVIGGGGASRSAIYALHYLLGVSEIYLVSRLKSETDELISWFTRDSSSGPEFKAKLRGVHSLEEAKTLTAPYYAVGAIPDLPPQTDGEKLSYEITRELLGRKSESEKGLLLEMCYHPRIRTSLYDYAESNGWYVIPGTVAMIWQAIAQHALWTESELINEDVVVEDLKKLVTEELLKRAKEEGN